jgi:hypothetical protein
MQYIAALKAGDEGDYSALTVLFEDWRIEKK